MNGFRLRPGNPEPPVRERPCRHLQAVRLSSPKDFSQRQEGHRAPRVAPAQAGTSLNSGFKTQMSWLHLGAATVNTFACTRIKHRVDL